MEPSTTGGSISLIDAPGFLATLCMYITTSKNLLHCLHPDAPSQAAEGKLRDSSLSFQEMEEGEITGLDSCVWIFAVVSKSIIWGNRVKGKWKAGSLPSACRAGTVLCEAPSIIR